MNKKVKFFFFVETEGKSTQTWAHITSIATILFALDLLFDYNPVKTAVRQFLPAINLTGPATATTA